MLFPQKSNTIVIWISKAYASVGSYSQTTTHGSLIDCDEMGYKHSISYWQDQPWTQAECRDQNSPKTSSFGSVSGNHVYYQLCFSQSFINRKRTEILIKIIIQFISAAQSCPTLCDPMNCSMPGLPVHHQLLELTQTHVHRVSDVIQPSHLLSSPSPLAPNPSQHQSLFQWANSSHEVAKVLEFQL